MTAPDRISRVCATCGVEDDHAHHVQYVAFTHPVTGEGVDLSVTKHVQCCASDGCEICAIDVAQANEQPHVQPLGAGPSSEFTEYMQNKTDAHLRVLFEEQAIPSPNYSFPDTSTTEVTSG